MKQLLILATALTMTSAAFAQGAKPTGLTNGDVKSWAKNLKAIERDFDNAGLSRDDIAEASKQEKAKAESILQKHGISAPHRVNKFAMINQCATIVMAESGAVAGMDANTMAMLKQMGVDPFAELKAKTNQKDCKVVKANEKAVIAAMNGIDDPAGNTQAGNAPAGSPQAGDASAGGAPAGDAQASAAPAGDAAGSAGGAAGSAGDAAGSANSGSAPKDYAEFTVMQMRAGNPDMTDEEAEAMAQAMRKQPSYAIQQAQWQSNQRNLASASQESAQEAEAEYKQIEKTATKFRNAVEEFTRSKGDCGLIYKKMDKAGAAKYVKKTPVEWETLMIRVDSDVLAFIAVKDRKKVELSFDWNEPKIKKTAFGVAGYDLSDVETEEMSKIIPITITNIEMYEASGKNFTAKEYVISTKEGKVIHLWQKWNGDKETSRVNFNGLKDSSSWSWGETGGN